MPWKKYCDLTPAERERQKETHRRWVLENRDKYNQYHHNYVANHREAYAQYHHEYYMAHREQLLEYARRRRALRRMEKEAADDPV